MIHTSPWPAPEIPPVTLTQHVLAAAARRGEHLALIDASSGETVTFAGLARAIPAAAAELVGAGVRPGDVVALVAPNRPAWPIALHGALAAGASVAPLGPLGTVEDLTHQLRISRAAAVVADEGVAEKVREAAGRAGLRAVVPVGRLTGAPAPGTPAALPPPAEPTSVAVLPFSSGTTGLPKAVALTHRNLVANLQQHRAIQHIGPSDVLCAVVPFSHSYGLTLVLHVALTQGATLVTLPRFQVDAYVEAIAAHGVTRLFVAPPVLRALADLPPTGRYDKQLASVQVAVCGAASLDPALAAAVTARFGFPVVQGYGMTEASPGTHFTPDDRWRDVPPGSVGWLIPGTEARIEPLAGGSGEPLPAGPGKPLPAGPGEPLPAGPGEPLPAGSVAHGELWIRGPQVMAGYLDAPDATAATIDPDGWLCSGDVVRVDERGCFYVVDRIKELIKYNGYQVPPAELEAVLMGHPAVRDVAVVGVPDPVAGELPKAFVVAGEPVDAGELLGWVAERVAPYKKIRLVEQVGEIPRSPAGKILRRALRGH